MDAIAAQAEVSKRTVYDYYGDKRRLLLGVIEDAGEAALGTLRQLVEQYLSDEVASERAKGIEGAVAEFAAALGSSLLVSSTYAAAVKLIAENESLLPELEDHPLDKAQTHVLAERIAYFARHDLLEVEDPTLAAEHFQALTALRVLNAPLRRRAEPEHVRRIMVDGAQAFMRAYGR